MTLNTTGDITAKRPVSIDDTESPITPYGATYTSRPNALASKVTSVLAASYADLELRDALALLDGRGLENSPEVRRQLRSDVQKDVIESNGAIIAEFGNVAEVERSRSLH